MSPETVAGSTVLVTSNLSATYVPAHSVSESATIPLASTAARMSAWVAPSTSVRTVVLVSLVTSVEEPTGVSTTLRTTSTVTLDILMLYCTEVLSTSRGLVTAGTAVSSPSAATRVSNAA